MGPERIPFFYCRSLKIFQISNKLLKIPNRPSRKRQNTKKTKIKKSIPISTPPVRRFLVFPSSRTFFLIRVFCVFALRTPGDAVSPYRTETYASFTAAPAADRKTRIAIRKSQTAAGCWLLRADGGMRSADPTLFQSQLLKMSHRHQIKAKNRKKGKRKTINKSVPISTPPSGVFWFSHRPGLFPDPCLLRLRTRYTGRCRQSVPRGNACFFHGCTRRCREPSGSFIFVPYRSIGFAFLHYRSFFPV